LCIRANGRGAVSAGTHLHASVRLSAGPPVRGT
jgi:hypothetical protein